eukprot:TRINITY_DN1682_c0_g1_i1.p1 TRINITY_DN1682_c0_g1~~TRINITY_DN1682_c0_g1_i1.p1  ORF type:complete len:338 (+),score=58.33 TRINITY_DN1682_c0_g1_i1:504-1517(+)
MEQQQGKGEGFGTAFPWELYFGVVGWLTHTTAQQYWRQHPDNRYALVPITPSSAPPPPHHPDTPATPHTLAVQRRFSATSQPTHFVGPFLQNLAACLSVCKRWHVKHNTEFFWKELTRVLCYNGAPHDSVGFNELIELEQTVGVDSWFELFKYFSTRLAYLERKATPFRILVVDDNRLNQLVLVRCLKNLGCVDVTCADGGSEALGMLAGQDRDPCSYLETTAALAIESPTETKEQQPQQPQQPQQQLPHCYYDIVFLDQVMPVMSGKECMERIMQNYPKPVCPFVVALTVSGTIDKDQQPGIVGVLHKPVHINDIWNVLAHMAFASQPLTTIYQNC